jgi:fatty acid desaturase
VLIKPDISARSMTIQRFSYLTLLFTLLAELTLATGHWWGLYYFLLWLVPLGTSFSFFMILRQVVQHGNADMERLTNTRIFLVGQLIRWSVFPLGMDYHLPHHMFPMVPHYRLKQLHELLLETESYRKQAVVVDGYFFHHEHPPVHPTVLDLMAQPR